MRSYKRGKHIPGGYDYIAGFKIFDSEGPNLYIVILFWGGLNVRPSTSNGFLNCNTLEGIILN